MEAAIVIQNLHKSYRGSFAPALNGLSLSVPRNSIYGLLGPNGAGKTTTLSILCGLFAADAGSVRILGRDVNKQKTEVLRHIGLVPQKIALFGNLTARENLHYIGKLYGLKRDDIARRSQELLERMNLEKHADKNVVRFSGGMQRRANLIAALLHQPDILILDEPTAGVDVQSRALILSFLKEYHRQGKTILYTSHLLDEAEQLCEEVAIMDEGKHVIDGTPAALIAQTPDSRKLEDVFLAHTGHSIRD